MDNLLDKALKLSSVGFHVFPLNPNTKDSPAIKDWPNKATKDPKQIKEWFGNGKKYNIGISTSKFSDNESLFVLDVDVKNSKDGYKTLSQLENELGISLRETLTQRTPTGGAHLIFKSTEPLKQGVNVFGDGLDVRANGGYIVGHGSVIDGKSYEIINDKPIAILPDKIKNKAKKSKTNYSKVISVEINEDMAIQRSIFYLENEAPLAIEGKGGDHTTFKVAAHVKDLGVSKESCLSLLNKHWNSRCLPPWNFDELSVKVNNAYSYSENPAGVLAPEAVFSPILENKSQISPKPDTSKKLPLEFFKDIVPNLERSTLVEGMLDIGASSVVFGESNKGKTFLVLGIALCVARGKPFCNKEVDQGAVLYVSAEGSESVKKRIQALKIYYKIEKENVPFALIPSSVDLRESKEDVFSIIEAAKTTSKTFGSKINLIIIDTLARAIAGGNENSSEDMGAFVRNIDLIREQTGAHVLVVHHAGKDTAKGARGHSSLKGAVDTEIEVTEGTVKNPKNRDRPKFTPFHFKLESVEIGKDNKGNIVTSAVMLPDLSKEFEKPEIKEGSVDHKALEALKEAIDQFGVEAEESAISMFLDSNIVSEDQWRKVFKERFYPDSKDKTMYSAFDRGLKNLSAKFAILKFENKWGLHV